MIFSIYTNKNIDLYLKIILKLNKPHAKRLETLKNVGERLDEMLLASGMLNNSWIRERTTPFAANHNKLLKIPENLPKTPKNSQNPNLGF